MTEERWKSLSKSEQLLNVGSEIIRAKIWQNKDKENFILALERALELIDLSFADPRWHDESYAIFWLRNEIAKFYAGLADYDIGILYKAL